MALTPGNHGVDERQQRGPQLRERVLRAWRELGIDGLGHQPVLDQLAELEVEHAGRRLGQLTVEFASAASGESLAELIRGLQRQGHYKSHFLIPCKGDKLLPLAVEQVQYFCIADGVTKAVVSDREHYVLPNTLDELTDSLDPARFFRVNRQYLISRGAVQDIDLWFNNRLAINLKVPTDGKILVSKLRVNDFKNWFSGS